MRAHALWFIAFLVVLAAGPAAVDAAAAHRGANGMLAYATSDTVSGSVQIRLASPGGQAVTSPFALTLRQAARWGPAFSPDGSSLAYTQHAWDCRARWTCTWRAPTTAHRGS